jgi:hypothetical protein
MWTGSSQLITAFTSLPPVFLKISAHYRPRYSQQSDPVWSGLVQDFQIMVFRRLREILFQRLQWIWHTEKSPFEMFTISILWLCSQTVNLTSQALQSFLENHLIWRFGLILQLQPLLLSGSLLLGSTFSRISWVHYSTLVMGCLA